MIEAELAALATIVSLVVYALSGGADFGGGAWDLLATGPRAAAQRALIERAISPIWEANHVWLILVVVLLFTCFPPAFAALSTALHVPLTLVLLGIVARGTAFVFRHYGPRADAARWGRVFAVASTVTPLFLGVTLGALTAGIPLVDGAPKDGFLRPWLHLQAFATGAQVVALFAFLAATYLVCETDDPELRDDFRLRALASGGVASLLAAGVLGLSPARFRDALLSAWPLVLATVATGGGALAAHALRRAGLARSLAAGHAALLVVGWGWAQRPFLIAPDLTIASAAAPQVTLRVTLVALALGAVLVLPSLWFLLRTFKASALAVEDEAPR